MIYCKELNQNFEDKQALFKELKANKDKIIGIKRKAIYTGYNPLDPENSKQIVRNSQVKLKALNQSASKELFKDDNYYYFAVNTTGILDSHNDLHVKGIWNKSAKEQSGKNYLVDTHSLTMKDIISYPEDVKIIVAEIPFKALGYNYKGDTEALVYKVLKDDIRGEELRKDIEAGKSMQASVKMQYVNILLAMNSEDEDDAEELKVYEKNIDGIANIQDFKEKPHYFFVVKEAKNIQESSLVPYGSNHVTGKIPSQPTQVTGKQTQEPSNDTPQSFINTI